MPELVCPQANGQPSQGGCLLPFTKRLEAMSDAGDFVCRRLPEDSGGDAAANSGIRKVAIDAFFAVIELDVRSQDRRVRFKPKRLSVAGLDALMSLNPGLRLEWHSRVVLVDAAPGDVR